MSAVRIESFEDLASALRRFEELFGSLDGSKEAQEFHELSDTLRTFEDRVAANLRAQRLNVRGLLPFFPMTCPQPSNLP